MNIEKKYFYICLCLIVYTKIMVASFLFHDGAKARKIYILDHPSLTTTTANQLPLEGTVIFADPHSSFSQEARVVTIAANQNNTQWLVTSAIIKDPTRTKCNSLEQAQAIALSFLQQDSTPTVYPARIPDKKKKGNPQQWRKT